MTKMIYFVTGQSQKPAARVVGQLHPVNVRGHKSPSPSSQGRSQKLHA